jgi:hypothetical protein
MSRRNRRWLQVAVCVLASLTAAAPASPTFHLMLIVEVFVGSAAAPNAQYVVLQMYDAGQNQLGGHPMRFYDASGVEIVPASSFGTISNDDDDANILIATSTAEALFGVSADLRVPARMLVAGAKVCFDDVDCFAWGSYSGSPTGVGTPFSDFGPDVSAKRIFTEPLDALDDTNNSEIDFQSEAGPTPHNNSGDVGFRNADAVFLDGFEDNGFSAWDDVVPPVG